MSVFTNPSGGSPQNASAYMSALLELLGDRDPREVLGATAAALRAATRSVSLEQLRRPEAPGKWSVIHVVQHLADSDLVWAWRLRLVIAQDRPPLTPYDQDRWAERLNYDEARLDDGLEQFNLLRRLNLQLIDRLSEDERARVGVHAERGDESVDRMMRLYAGHDLRHLRQIDRIRAA